MPKNNFTIQHSLKTYAWHSDYNGNGCCDGFAPHFPPHTLVMLTAFS
ncbi:MAG: hypothetical protein J6B60_06000 [Clostridia bacterium]|nr:hypothetical protein [Clostridia bacterium]